MPHAVIFDMDGVLIDSYEAHFESWRKLAEQLGENFTREAFTVTFGRTSREIIAENFGEDKYSGEEIAKLDDRKEAHFREIISADFPTMPGAEELLAALQQAGFKMAVGSSGPRDNIALTLSRLGDGNTFSATVTGDDVTKGKPHPQVFLTAAEKLDMEPSNCCVVEDAPAGIQAAHAAGMACVGLASTGRTRESLASADLVIDHLGELSPAKITALIEQTRK